MPATFSSLTINGKTHSKDELSALCNAVLESRKSKDWEKALYHFIKEWLNDHTYIEAQTSGSTGNPKTIFLEKEKMAASARMTLDHLNIRQGENALLSLSCNYIAGKMMVVRAFVGGLNLFVTKPSNDPLEYLPEKQKIDFAAWIPMQLQQALENESAEKISGIRNILIGGAPLPRSLKIRIGSFSNNIYETYGMTETTSHIALKLLSRNTENEYFETLQPVTVQQDKRGCLVINAPQLSAHPITTNDLVELKDATHFKWAGRADHIINSGGIKLSPEKLEARMEKFIRQPFFLAGIPDDDLGEKLVLVIEGDPFSQEKAENLLQQLKGVLGKYELPKKILFAKAFQKTPSGKIQRKETMKQLI